MEINKTYFCPDCRDSLALVPGDASRFICNRCKLHWILENEELRLNLEKDLPPSRLMKLLKFTVSLPERTLRTTVGLGAGAARELAAALVPGAFQNSKSYELVVKKSLQFLTETVGGVKSPLQAAEQAEEDFLARKVVGNFLDLAGLATLHVSPIWMLAIVSDVAYGSKAYLQELAAELQKQGVIDEHASIHKIDDLLEAVQNSSGQVANMFDTPPLSVDELKDSLRKTREALGDPNVRELIPQANLTRYWEEMRDMADKENVSLLDISSAVTLYALGKVKTVSQGGLVGIKVAGGMLHQHVLTHYRDGLNRIQEKGYYETVRETALPYVTAVWTNFSHQTPMLTERLMESSFWKGAWGKVQNMLARRPDQPALTEPEKTPPDQPEILPPEKEEPSEVPPASPDPKKVSPTQPEEVPPFKSEPDRTPSHTPEPPAKEEPKAAHQTVKTYSPEIPLLPDAHEDMKFIDLDSLDRD